MPTTPVQKDFAEVATVGNRSPFPAYGTLHTPISGSVQKHAMRATVVRARRMARARAL
jgi:hypothetical protein